MPRLKLLKAEYEALIEKDISNKVLGSADEYYRFYSREQLEILAHKIDPITPECPDDWMIPVAKNIDFSQVQFPLLLVQEYGLSVFRLAATASLATDALTDCQVLTQII